MHQLLTIHHKDLDEGTNVLETHLPMIKRIGGQTSRDGVTKMTKMRRDMLLITDKVACCTSGGTVGRTIWWEELKSRVLFKWNVSTGFSGQPERFEDPWT